MAEINYEKINNYLNDLFSYLYPLDQFLLDNFKTIILINKQINQLLKEYDFADRTQEFLTFEDVYLKARECVSYIDEEYLELFDSMISDGTLNFDYECPNGRSTSLCIYLSNQNIFKTEINLSMSFSYCDVINLVHEFFHIVNGKVKEKSINRYILGEFISIYFELKAIEYIENKEEINIHYCYKKRFENTSLLSSRFSIYSIPLFLFENNGSVTENGDEFITQYLFPIEKKEYKKYCRRVLNNLEYYKNKYMNSLGLEEKYDHKTYLDKIGRMYAIDYHYILGTILAFYAKENVSIEKMKWLNYHINDDFFGNMDIIDILKYLNIDIEGTNFINEVLNIFNKEIKGYVKKR